MTGIDRLGALDWTEISRRVLEAAAKTLAEAARRRAAAAPGAIGHAVTQDDRATVRVSDATLIRRELGDVGRPPRPFLAPDAADRHAIRAAVVTTLRKELT